MKIQRILPVLLLPLVALACGGGGGGSSSGANSSGPSKLTFGLSEAVLLLGVPVDLVPTVKGKVKTWTVAPALPPGLALDPVTGAIAGTATAAVDELTYTVTASNNQGKASTNIKIRTSAPARWAFTPNIGDNTISSYAVEADTGRMIFRGSYFDTNSEPGPEEAIVHPTLPYLYVPNLRDASKPSDISIFPIDTATGALETALPPVGTGSGPHSLRFSPDGGVCYVSNNGADEVRTFAVDPATGNLTQVATVDTGNGPWNLAVDPLGRYLYVANRLDETISVFTIDPGTGNPQDPGEVFDLNQSSPFAMTVHPSGDYLLVATENFKFLLSLRIDPPSGEPLEIVNGMATDPAPAGIAVHPSGEVVYVASRDNDTVTAHPFDPATGMVSAGSAPIPTGDEPSGLTLDDAGFSLFVPCRVSDDVYVYDLSDPFEPVEASRIRGRQAPRVLGLSGGIEPIDPRVEALHVLNADDDTISSFVVDQEVGTLDDAGVTTLAGTVPAVIAVDPMGRFVWVCTHSPDVLQTFRVDPATQSLTPLGTPLSMAPEPSGIGVSPGGGYLWVTSQTDDEVVSYRVHPEDGTLRLVESESTWDKPGAAIVDPTGQFLYVAGEGSARIGAYRIGQGTFLNFAVSGVCPPGSTPKGLSFSAAGDQLYVAIPDEDLVLAFSVDSTTGDLTLNPPGAVAAGQPTAVAMHPKLNMAYASLNDPPGTGGIARFVIDPATGRPIYLNSVPGGLNPIDVTIDPDGNFLLATNQVGGDVSVFAIDDVGGITELLTAPVGNGPLDMVLLTTFD